MKIYAVLLLFIISTTMLFGQRNYQELCIGNIGIIPGDNPEQSQIEPFKYNTTDGQIVIHQIAENFQPSNVVVKQTINNVNIHSDPKTGYKGIIELGYQAGAGDWGLDRLTLNIVGGYQVNPYFSVGLGTGVRYYLDVAAVLIPFYTDIRADILKKNFSPYLSFGVGYSFDATNDFKGVGFLLNPDVGIKIKLSPKFAISVGIGYEIQQIDFYHSGFSYHSNTENSGAISINVGMITL